MSGTVGNGPIAVRATEQAENSDCRDLAAAIRAAMPSSQRQIHVTAGSGPKSAISRAKRADLGISPGQKDRLIRALRSGFPLSEAVDHAKVRSGRVLAAMKVDSAFRTEVRAAMAYQRMLARAVVKQNVPLDARLAERVLRDSLANEELARLRELTTD